MFVRLFLSLALLFAGALSAVAQPAGSVSAEGSVPAELEVEQPGVEITLVAEHPQVVTPTGIDIGEGDRVWVVASHTHFRPENYGGPQHDEVVVLSPEGNRRVFYNQTDHTMDLELGPDGWVYLAERDRILRVRDTDGDGVGDEEENLAVLETEGTYPHNGLAGLAWHPSGDLVFSLGENHWEHWVLRGADGATVTGTGEGGVFRCSADGRGVRRLAKGFWNPFGICVRGDGTIFAAENDPGARPPCRLLHVVEGGDYGYQRLYGRAPFHPFVGWNGELRGTLPMTHSVGEAPCGIVPLGSGLIVPTWTENRIDFYPLRPHGASFETERVILVRGSEFFRPTCIVQASPTVFYLADWVYGSYELHGYGRVWKLEIDPEQAGWLPSMELAEPTAAAREAERLRRGGGDESDEDLFRIAGSSDPFLARAAIDALAARVGDDAADRIEKLSPTDRITWLLAMRKAEPKNAEWVRRFWKQESEEIQFETLRWIADEQLSEFLPQVKQKLRASDQPYRLFEAALAAFNTLSGNPRTGVADPEMLMRRLRDEDASPRTRAFALRLLDPNHGGLSEKLFDRLIDRKNAVLTAEVTRTLADRGTAESRERLEKIATDSQHAVPTRADAIAGLANPAAQRIPTLLSLAASDRRAIREEALRSLRFAELDRSQRQRLSDLAIGYPASKDLVDAVLDPKSLTKGRPAPDATEAWQKRLAEVEQPVDREAGRRLFYHASIATCAKCHRHSGRGNVVGPDLSAASTTASSRDALLTALLEPSAEVDPQFHPWALLTEDGRAFTGILLRNGGRGTEFYRDNAGRERKFKSDEIVARRQLKTSMMPDGLIDTMTDRELRDLLAFLDGSSNDSAAEGALSRKD